MITNVLNEHVNKKLVISFFFFSEWTNKNHLHIYQLDIKFYCLLSFTIFSFTANQIMFFNEKIDK